MNEKGKNELQQKRNENQFAIKVNVKSNEEIKKKIEGKKSYEF